MVEILDNRFVVRDDIPARKGGFAVVKKATDIVGGGFVAVKLLVGAADDLLKRLFERETELLRKSDHPNIVRYIDSGIDETGTPYVVLAWVEHNLADVLEQDALTGWSLFMSQVLRPLADAVAYLHRQGVEHRDIKAINVLADLDHSPLLADFGIAKQHDEGGSSETVANFGTWLWSPPEGAGAREYTRDVFALGVMCVYGMAPVSRRPQTYEDLAKVLSELDLPDELRSLISSAIDRDPELRPRNAIEFLRRLDNALDAQKPAPRRTAVYLGLTTTARRQIVGDHGILERASDALLQDLQADSWATLRWDSEKKPVRRHCDFHYRD